MDIIPFKVIFNRKYRRHVGACLCYHEVRERECPTLSNFSTVISEKNFSKHIQFIANNFTVLHPEEFTKRIMKKELPERACMVTFDDGFASTANVAYPILKKYGIPFTVFISTGYIENNMPWDYHILSSTINTAKFSGSKFIEFEGLGFIFDNTSRTMLNKSESVITDLLQNKIPHTKRKYFLNHLRQQLDAEGSVKLPEMMTIAEVKRLSDSDVIIGAHTEWHISVESDGPEEFKRQAQSSRLKLEEITGKKIKYFAYPYGLRRHCQPAKDLVRESGYDFAFTCFNRPATAYQGPYMIDRIGASRGIVSLVMGLLECKPSQIKRWGL